MKLIASDWFGVPGVPRLVRPAELIETTAAKGRKLVADGLALPIKRAPEFATRRPRENAALRTK